MDPATVAEGYRELEAGACPDPFSLLGIHPLPGTPSSGGEVEGGWEVRVYLPWAAHVSLLPLPDEGSGPGPEEGGAGAGSGAGHGGPGDGAGGWETAVEMAPGPVPGAYLGRLPGGKLPPGYRLLARNAEGQEVLLEDPYRFPPLLDEDRLKGFLAGEEARIHEFMGAHPVSVDGVAGVRFAVWAPRARAVSVVGTMNQWDGRLHPMRPRGSTGVWELFLPGVRPGDLYKYRIRSPLGGLFDKADPVGFQMEVRPNTASVVTGPVGHRWGDGEWMEARARTRPEERPMSVYEVHLGSWRRTGAGTWMGYRELAETLLPYVADLGFTHVELMPVMEHPLDESWGYQTVGYFAATARYGSPDDLRAFVDRAHQLGLGVILDWVPGHFPDDGHGLIAFDGTPLYEHPDPRRGRHPDWGTLIFDYGKPAVRSFLLSSALWWLESFHVDGLRVDAVASMLYLDYSRGADDWVPNQFGGKENLEAVRFLKELNLVVHETAPGALVIAEESTAWPRVSHGVEEGGLGFDQKWNMGWMHDTLDYFSADPLYRSGLQEKLTFSLMYAFSERFVLALSHDEVVHGKGSLLGKMPGEYAEQFANLRLLLAYQWLHPGKKLLFMGSELGEWGEWWEGGSLDWALLGFPSHRGLQRWVRTLNRLYAAEPALHALDHRQEGFEWLDCHDAERSTLSFVRWDPERRDPFVVVLNATPVTREAFQLAVPLPGRWQVELNSDELEYGGGGRGVSSPLESHPTPLHGREQSVTLDLPGLTCLVLRRG